MNSGIFGFCTALGTFFAVWNV